MSETHFDDGLGYVEIPGLAEWPTIESVIEKLEKQHKLPQFTGHSGRGWSYYSTLERCPRAFQLRYVRQIKQEERISDPRAVGTIFHAYTGLRDWLRSNYNRLEDEPACTPAWMRKQLLEAGCNPEVIEEAWRIFQAYENEYCEDYLIPLAIEHHHGDKFGKTCRYDLIARIEEPIAGFEAGIYAVDRKTAAKFTEDMLTGWDLDGEMLGQIALWDRKNKQGYSPREQFGPLAGVIVDITGKQKLPQFYRAFIAPQSIMTARHLKVLNHLDRKEQEFRRKRFWPQYFNGCISRYGKCDFWDICANEGIRS